MSRYITVPLPDGLSTHDTNQLLHTLQRVVDVAGITAEPEITDLHLTDQERLTLHAAVNLAITAVGTMDVVVSFTDAEIAELLALRNRLCPNDAATDQINGQLEHDCAFGPEGEHHKGELVHCTVCDRPTCDYCGSYASEAAYADGDWRCPDHAEELR